MSTHRLHISWGSTGRVWTCDSEQEAREILAGQLARGFEHKSPCGTITIIPPWRFTKIEIKPIRRRHPAPAPTPALTRQ